MGFWLYMLTVKIYLNAPKCPRRGLALIRMWNIYYLFVLPSSFSMLFLWADFFSFPAATPALLVTWRNGLRNKRVLTVFLWMLQGCLRRARGLLRGIDFKFINLLQLVCFIFYASLSDFVCIKVLALNRKFLWGTLIRLWLPL